MYSHSADLMYVTYKCEEDLALLLCEVRLTAQKKRQVFLALVGNGFDVRHLQVRGRPGVIALRGKAYGAEKTPSLPRTCR